MWCYLMDFGSVVLLHHWRMSIVRHTLPTNSRFTKLTYKFITYFHSLDMPNAEHHRHSFYFTLYILRQWSLPLSRDNQSLQLLGLRFSLSIIMIMLPSQCSSRHCYSGMHGLAHQVRWHSYDRALASLLSAFVIGINVDIHYYYIILSGSGLCPCLGMPTGIPIVCSHQWHSYS